MNSSVACLASVDLAIELSAAKRVQPGSASSIYRVYYDQDAASEGPISIEDRREYVSMKLQWRKRLEGEMQASVVGSLGRAVMVGGD